MYHCGQPVEVAAKISPFGAALPTREQGSKATCVLSVSPWNNTEKRQTRNTSIANQSTPKSSVS
jgi:hypothetical protein